MYYYGPPDRFGGLPPFGRTPPLVSAFELSAIG